MGLCERAEGEQGEQERVDAFALGGCEGVLEVLQERCNRVFFYRVVSFECYHSGWNLLQAALFCTRPMYHYQGWGGGAMFKSHCKDTYNRTWREGEAVVPRKQEVGYGHRIPALQEARRHGHPLWD